MTECPNDQMTQRALRSFGHSVIWTMIGHWDLVIGASLMQGRLHRDLFDVLRQQTFFALDLFVLHLLAVFERTEAISVDAGVVDENILAVGIHDEPEALLRIEPLDGACRHDRPPTNVVPCTRDMEQILPVLKLPYVSRQNTLANRLNQQFS